MRHSGVRFGNQRDGGIWFEYPDHFGHLRRPGRTVAAEGVSSERLQCDQCRNRMDSGQGPAAGFEGEGDDRREVAQLAHGDQGGARLLQIHHRFDGEAVDAAVDQAAHLFLVQFDRFLEGEGAEWFDQLAGRGDVAEDQFAGDGAAGDFREFPVDFPGVFFQIEFRKLERVSTEGRRIYQIGTGCGVSLLNGGQRFRVLQNPRFGTDAGGHASFDQFGSGCAVQLDQSLFDQGVKAGSGHGVFPLFTVLSFL